MIPSEQNTTVLDPVEDPPLVRDSHRIHSGISSSRGASSGLVEGGGAQWEYQSNVNPEELFKTIFGEFSRARGGSRGFGNPFDEIFSNFQFRGGMEATCHLTFNQAAKGVAKEVEVVEVDRLGSRQKRIVQVPIPAGVADGQTLR